MTEIPLNCLKLVNIVHLCCLHVNITLLLHGTVVVTLGNRSFMILPIRLLISLCAFFGTHHHHPPVPARRQVQACRAGGEQQLGRSRGPEEGGGGAGRKHGPRQRLLPLEAFRILLFISSPGPVRGRRPESRCAGPDVPDRLMEEGHDGPGGHYSTQEQGYLCCPQNTR